jgi:hypothetical protein
VVRQRSAKPLFPSSNLGGASKINTMELLEFKEFFVVFRAKKKSRILLKLWILLIIY